MRQEAGAVVAPDGSRHLRTPRGPRAGLVALVAAFLAAGPAAAQAAGGGPAAPDCGGPQRDRPAVADRIIGAANGLGFDLLRSLAADAPNSNVAVSPYSVAVALGLVHMGAAGSTADAMAAAMQLTGIDSDTVGLTHAWVLNRVRCSGVEGTDVRIANGLWLAALLEPRADYLARARSQYRAEVAALDFSAGDAAAPINAWVSERTAGKIENAIARVPANAALIWGSGRSRSTRRLRRTRLLPGKTAPKKRFR